MTHWNDTDIDHDRFRLGKLRESMLNFSNIKEKNSLKIGDLFKFC